jgi:hypothetical protein
MATDRSPVQRLGEYVVAHRRGMVGDLVFAIVWVTVVNAFFRLVDGPTWAYYLMMFAGVLAYFGFVYSFQAAKASQE